LQSNNSSNLKFLESLNIIIKFTKKIITKGAVPTMRTNKNKRTSNMQQYIRELLREEGIEEDSEENN
jgi:hypothetical protein